MAQGEPRRIGVTVEMKPHAYDPARNPELFEGVLARRVLAFAIDVAIILAPVALAFVVIILFGLVTLGLGWALLWLLYPGTVIWALVYYGSTLGSPASATIGMRVMEIEMRTWYGAPCYFVLGAVHAVVLCLDIDAHAAGAAGLPVQRTPPPAARHRARHRGDQQPGARRDPARRPLVARMERSGMRERPRPGLRRLRASIRATTSHCAENLTNRLRRAILVPEPTPRDPT